MESLLWLGWCQDIKQWSTNTWLSIQCCSAWTKLIVQPHCQNHKVDCEPKSRWQNHLWQGYSAACQCPPQQINHQPAHHNWQPPAWVLQLSGLYKVVVDKDYLGLTLKLKINKFHWYYTGIIKLVYISNTRYAIAWHFNYFCIKYLSQLNSVLTWVGSDLIMSRNPPHLPAHMKL